MSVLAWTRTFTAQTRVSASGLRLLNSTLHIPLRPASMMQPRVPSRRGPEWNDDTADFLSFTALSTSADVGARGVGIRRCLRRERVFTRAIPIRVWPWLLSLGSDGGRNNGCPIHHLGLQCRGMCSKLRTHSWRRDDTFELLTH